MMSCLQFLNGAALHTSQDRFGGLGFSFDRFLSRGGEGRRRKGEGREIFAVRPGHGKGGVQIAPHRVKVFTVWEKEFPGDALRVLQKEKFPKVTCRVELPLNK